MRLQPSRTTRLLDSEEGQDEFLLGGLAVAADCRGFTLKDNEVYIFAPLTEFRVEALDAADGAERADWVSLIFW